MLKVAIVGDYPMDESTVSGGIQSVIANLVEGLQHVTRIDLHIVAPGGVTGQCDIKDGVTVHRVGPQSPPGFLTYGWQQRRQILHVLNVIKPDLAHFHGVYGWTIGCRVPTIVTAHGILEHDVLLNSRGAWLGQVKALVVKLVENYARRRVGHHIIINRYVLEELGDRIRGTTDFIPNPVEEKLFALTRAHNAPESGKVLFVGRIRPLKNVVGLIKAFAACAREHPSATLQIIGAPDQRWYLDRCRAEVSRLGVDNAVRFRGALKREELLAEYSTASCVVLPSFQETSPMVIAEAMAVGVPVVAAAIGGITYMIEEGVTGFLCDPKDDTTLATRISSLLGDKGLNQQIGANARRYATQQYKSDSVAEQTAAVYRRVAE